MKWFSINRSSIQIKERDKVHIKYLWRERDKEIKNNDMDERQLENALYIMSMYIKCVCINRSIEIKERDRQRQNGTNNGYAYEIQR